MVKMIFFLASLALSVFVIYCIALIWFSDTRNRRLMSFFLVGLDVCLWSLFNGISVIISDSDYPFFYTLRMIIVCILPYALFWFFLSYSGSKLANNKFISWIIIIIPAVDILALLTNPLHKLYFTDFVDLIPITGILFWIHTGFSYFTILLGTVWFFIFIFRAAKGNPLVLFTGIGTLIPWAVNVLYTFAGKLLPVNLSPIVFCLSFSIFFFSSYKFHLFNFKNSALAVLFETYQEAIVLTGKDGRIIDFNNKFTACFPSFDVIPRETPAEAFIGYLRTEARNTVPEDLFENPDASAFAGGEFTVFRDGRERIYHISLQYFEDEVHHRYKKAVDYSITFHDITEDKERNRRLLDLKTAAETASQAKSSFLANTSHEIRTPLNAIIGIVELILRKDISSDVYEDAMNIKQAGNNLLTIINDILDISKIESGKMEISSHDYRFTTLINECIGIIRVRISDKRIRFITNIDSKIPEQLSGDMARVRQILLNLLNNAVKYTEEGYIKFSVRGEFRNSVQNDAQGTPREINLIFEIEDTGIGIKTEDMHQLFDNFARLDSHRNQNIEGTGLGLSISHNLIQLMGGDITVESVYGKGSLFKAVLPQKVRDSGVIAQVENPELKPVLLYERRTIYGESVFYSLQNLEVPVNIVEPERLQEELLTEKWAFVFVSPDVGEGVLNFIKEKRLKTVMVLLARLEEVSIYKYTPKITIPTYTAPVANVLNGVMENKSHEHSDVCFTARGAKVLVVDDIDTNLIVAQGFLSVYQMEVHTCNTGKKAIKLIQENRYDMIFLDHMMPEMDGIETAARIREWEKEQQEQLPGGVDRGPTPIIALTANAVVGMKDVFLGKGFNDFISKPIEIQHLEEMVLKWIPKEKQQQKETSVPIAITEWGVNTAADTAGIPAEDEWADLTGTGVDIQTGLGFTGGTEAGYRKVLAVFLRDAKERFALLEMPPDETARRAFVTSVHALKSASASIGAGGVSKQAAELETAGKEDDFAVLETKLPLFRQSLKALIEALDRTLKTRQGTETAIPHLPRFEELKAALKQGRPGLIDRILGDLGKISFNEETTTILAEIADAVLLGEYETAIVKIDLLLA
jgi:signal transduction histidine kinase/DNA-binding response OmpR family regulator/HPt (histidine-containing phosphotransfer) domain-containing protein